MPTHRKTPHIQTQAVHTSYGIMLSAYNVSICLTDIYFPAQKPSRGKPRSPSGKPRPFASRHLPRHRGPIPLPSMPGAWYSRPAPGPVDHCRTQAVATACDTDTALWPLTLCLVVWELRGATWSPRGPVWKQEAPEYRSMFFHERIIKVIV